MSFLKQYVPNLNEEHASSNVASIDGVSFEQLVNRFDELTDLVQLQKNIAETSTYASMEAITHVNGGIHKALYLLGSKHNWAMESSEPLDAVLKADFNLMKGLKSKTDSIWTKLKDFLYKIGLNRNVKMKDYYAIVDRVVGLNELEEEAFTTIINERKSNSFIIDPRTNTFYDWDKFSDSFDNNVEVITKFVSDIMGRHNEVNARAIDNADKILRQVVGKVPAAVNFPNLADFAFDMNDPTEVKPATAMARDVKLEVGIDTTYNAVKELLQKNVTTMKNRIILLSPGTRKLYEKIDEALRQLLKEYNPDAVNRQEVNYYIGLYRYVATLYNLVNYVDYFRIYSSLSCYGVLREVMMTKGK